MNLPIGRCFPSGLTDVKLLILAQFCSLYERLLNKVENPHHSPSFRSSIFADRVNSRSEKFILNPFTPDLLINNHPCGLSMSLALLVSSPVLAALPGRRDLFNHTQMNTIHSDAQSPQGGLPYKLEVTEMLVVSLRGVNCWFWSHLGCLGRKITQVSLRAAHTRGQFKLKPHPHRSP